MRRWIHSRALFAVFYSKTRDGTVNMSYSKSNINPPHAPSSGRIFNSREQWVRSSTTVEIQEEDTMLETSRSLGSAKSVTTNAFDHICHKDCEVSTELTDTADSDSSIP